MNIEDLEMPSFQDTANAKQGLDIYSQIFSKQGKEREEYLKNLQKFGVLPTNDEGALTEAGQGFLQSANQMIKGLGKTAEELGLGSNLRDWAGENLAANQQWNAPEDISTASYIGRAIGEAAGTTAVIAPFTAADVFLGTKGAISFAAIFSSTIGENIQRNREAYGEENSDKVYGLAAAESFVDAGIETLLGTIPMLGKTLKGLSYGAKQGIVRGIVQSAEKQLGKKAAHKFFVSMAKNGIEEGGEEALQYLNGWFWQTVGNDPNVKFSIAEMGEGALKGLIGGAALGTIGGISDETRTANETQNAEMQTTGQDIESELLPEAETEQLLNNDVQAQAETVQAQDNNIQVTSETVQVPAETQNENAILPEETGNIDIEQQSRIVNTLAEVFNLKVKYYDEAGITPVETENGTVDGIFDKKTGEILLDRNSPTNLNFLFGHEFKHFIDKQYSDLAQGFDTLVKKNINQEGQAELAEQGGNLQEFSADTFGRFFTDNDFLRQTAERLEQQQQGFGEKLLNAVKDFINAIRKKLKHIGTPDAKILFDNMGELRNTALDMLAEIKKRQIETETSVTNVTADIQTETPAITDTAATPETPATENIQPKKMTFDVNDFLISFDSQLRKIANQYKNSPIDVDDLIQEGRIAVVNAYDKYDGNGKATPKTFFSNVAKNAMLNALNKANRQNKNHISTEEAIGDNLKLEDVLPDNTENSEGQGEFDKVSYKENPEEFKARVKIFLDTLGVQDRRIMELYLNGMPPSKIARAADVVEKNRSKIEAKIKKLNQKMIENMGLMPHETKERFSVAPQVDTPAFKEWFGNSKVVDDNGKPLVVYHGSGTTFWEFKTEFTGLGNDQYGSGFYFTTNKETADIYTEKQLNGQTKIGGQDSPNVIQAYLSIKNPIVIDLNSDDMRPENLSRIEVTTKQAYEIIKRAPDIMDEENSPLGDFFEEYWKTGPSDSMIRKAARYTDVWDLLSLQGDWFGGDNGATAFREAVHEVLGYDGVQVNLKNGEKHYVAWFPNQIKSATDNVGTFDSNNPDIRYHITRKRKQINPIVQDGKVRDNYQDLLENREYTPETIEQWDKKAVDWIDKLGGILPAIDALVSGMRHKDRHVNTLIVRHILESDIANAMPSDDLIKIEEAYIDDGTAWGREGVARRLASMTLDRIERVQALFNKLNEGMEDKKLADLRKRIHDKLGIDILSLDKSILDDKDKLDEVLREYQAAKAGKMDKLYEFWINSILSAPATHIVNTVGNTANALYEYTAKRMGEAALNLFFKRKDAATFGEFKEIWKNFDLKGAIERSKVAFNREMLSPDNKFREYSELSIGGKTGRFIRLPTRSLAFMDELARNIIIPMETAAQAYRSGTAKGLKGDELQAYISEKLNSPNSAEFRNAIDKANELTFKKEPDKFVQELIAMKSQGGVVGTLLKYFLPFVTAPYNILMQGVRKGPLGIVKTVGETGQIIAGKRSIDSQYIGHVAEQFIAWGTLLMLAGMDDDDDLPFITGSNAPFGSAEQKFKEQNIPPYSVRIGGKYWSYKRIEPLATMLSITADTLQAYRDKKAGRDFKKNFINMYKNISDKTYLDSISELIRWVEDPEKSFASLGTNFIASWMPNAAKAFIMSADDEVRNNKSYEKGSDYALDMLHVITSKAGITQRLPKVDCFGETITKENAQNANPAWLYIGRFVGQYVKHIDEDDKVKKLILTYNLKSNPDEPYWPDIPRNTFSYQNEKYYFGNKDYHDFCVESGKLAKKQLDNAVRRGLLNVNNPTEADIKLIKKVFTRARKEVKTQFIRKGRFNKQ